MSDNLAFDFSVDQENRKITIRREFAAELPLVWDAFTKSEILDQWWAPQPWKAETRIMDFREGGHWLYAMVGPEGEKHWGKVNFDVVEELSRYTGLDSFTDEDGKINKDLPQVKWEVTFADKGPTTIVEIHNAYDDRESLEKTLEMGFREGMTIAMEGLDIVLASLKA